MGSEFDRVPQKVHDDLIELRRVDIEPLGYGWVDGDFNRIMLVLQIGNIGCYDFPKFLADLGFSKVDFQLVGINFPGVQDVVDLPHQQLSACDCAVHHLLLLRV